MVLYICKKFHENISNSFQFTEWTQVHGRNGHVQCSKHNTYKSRQTRLMIHEFCILSQGATIKKSETVSMLQSQHLYMVELAIVKSYDIQRAVTPKVGKLIVKVLLFCTLSHVLYICMRFYENISKKFPT